MSILNDIKTGNVNEVTLLEYISDNDINIAVAAAESEIATESVLDIAAHDKDRAVRMAAVNNLNTGIRTLKYLLQDSDIEIAKRAAKILEERER